MHFRKTLVFFWKNSTWVKNEGDEDFNIPMGCYDEAEICKLVGIYIQNKLCKLINKKDFGLYRDGIGIMRNTSGTKADRKRQNIITIFEECGLLVASTTVNQGSEFIITYAKI